MSADANHKANVTIDGIIPWDKFKNLSSELNKVIGFDFLLCPTIEQQESFQKEWNKTS